MNNEQVFMFLLPKKTRDKILTFSEIRKELLLVLKLVFGKTNIITLSALHLKLHQKDRLIS